MYPSPSIASAFNRRVAEVVHYFLGVALHTYRLRVSKEPLREIRRHPEAQRSALVAILC